MGSYAAATTRSIQSCMDQLVATLRGAAAAVESESLDVGEMTDVLKEALSNRNRFDAALTGAIGALDRVAERVPDGELTGGLSCAKYGYQGRASSSKGGSGLALLEGGSLGRRSSPRWPSQAALTLDLRVSHAGGRSSGKAKATIWANALTIVVRGAGLERAPPPRTP